MKFSVSSAELLRALATVGGAVPSKATMPILESILFERDGDRLRLLATDLEIYIAQEIGVRFETNGSGDGGRVAIPAKRLVDTLRALPDLPVTISTDDEFNVVVKTDQGRYKMVGFDGADYPALPELGGGQTVEASGALVKRAIQKASFAVSKDALRPAMMGIYFQIGPDEGRAVATDGHRLVRLTMDGLTSSAPVSFIVPEKALGLAARVATDEPAVIEVASGHVGFRFGTSRVIARLIDETYPNYEAVIPLENDRRLTANRLSLLAAVKRVALYTSSTTRQIRLGLATDRVDVSAEDIERASEAKETVLCDYTGEPMVIGFNADYLTEVLSNLDAEDVAMEFSSPNRAGVVTPGTQADGEDLLMLIMPVMLNTYA